LVRLNKAFRARPLSHVIAPHIVDGCPLGFAAIAAVFMNVIRIGIQVVMPQTGTSPKQPPPQADAQHKSASVALAADAPKQAPPPPGMGKLLDKTV
jgi:hypothetical protein